MAFIIILTKWAERLKKSQLLKRMKLMKMLLQVIKGFRQRMMMMSFLLVFVKDDDSQVIETHQAVTMIAKLKIRLSTITKC